MGTCTKVSGQHLVSPVSVKKGTVRQKQGGKLARHRVAESQSQKLGVKLSGGALPSMEELRGGALPSMEESWVSSPVPYVKLEWNGMKTRA